MDMTSTIKFRDEISPILQKIADNIRQASDLLAENKTLLE